MKNRFSPYEEAKSFAHSLKLKNWNEWKNYMKSEKRPWNIPTNPATFYKNKGWISYFDWLGKDRFLPFEEAKMFVNTLKLKNQKEWHAYSKSGKRSRNIPANPYAFYKNKGWIDWADWVGRERSLSYEKAKAFVHTLNLNSRKEWQAYSKSGKRPPNIPSNPDKCYRNKAWLNWYDWLGKEQSSKKEIS